jgi:uncharacterized protein YjbI with pentapeptide repeats
MKLKAPAAAATTTLLTVNWFSAICLAAFWTIISTSSAADTGTSAGELNPAEQWVVAQATAGEIADLSKQFPEEEDRQLSADFLETLLMGTRPDAKLHRHGVRIEGACIDEPIDLENAQIPCEVWLEHCQFNASTNFNGGSFAGTISFENSVFKADATFDSMKVGGVAIFTGAVFQAPVYFDSANIARGFLAQGTKFQDKEEGASFTSIKVGNAFFTDAVFEGPVTFLKADIDGIFDVGNAKFRNKEQGTGFMGMKVGGEAIFTGAVFEAPVYFDFSEFVYLDLSSASWPEVYMQGMSYKYIRAVPRPANEPKSHTALLKLANQSAYTANVNIRLILISNAPILRPPPVSPLCSEVTTPLVALERTRAARADYAQRSIAYSFRRFRVGVAGPDSNAATRNVSRFLLRPGPVPFVLGWMLSDAAANAMEEQLYLDDDLVRNKTLMNGHR